ncbi:hypothetical protein BGZ93_008900, partial [Podila epicladia]
MPKHVYPAWHKTAQRAFFLVGAVLCITLPVAYGKHRSISSKVLGSVLGVFFALWLVFSLFARFCVPSPRIESSLPIYTHSPIPVPVALHIPAKSDALPSAPAIRLHPSSPIASMPSTPRTARFAIEDDLTPQHTNHVSFQTRPRGNTADSTNSLVYPTYAAYRQAQHVNFEAFAQRVRRAFTLSQEQEQQQQLEILQLRDESDRDVQQQRAPTPTTLNAKAQGRSRSASAASAIGDFAERIKNGTIFRRSSSYARGNPDTSDNINTKTDAQDEGVSTLAPGDNNVQDRETK